jgi:hypothetical protein
MFDDVQVLFVNTGNTTGCQMLKVGMLWTCIWKVPGSDLSWITGSTN